MTRTTTTCTTHAGAQLRRCARTYLPTWGGRHIGSTGMWTSSLSTSGGLSA